MFSMYFPNELKLLFFFKHEEKFDKVWLIHLNYFCKIKLNIMANIYKWKSQIFDRISIKVVTIVIIWT